MQLFLQEQTSPKHRFENTSSSPRSRSFVFVSTTYDLGEPYPSTSPHPSRNVQIMEIKCTFSQRGSVGDLHSRFLYGYANTSAGLIALKLLSTPAKTFGKLVDHGSVECALGDSENGVVLGYNGCRRSRYPMVFTTVTPQALRPPLSQLAFWPSNVAPQHPQRKQGRC